jgi:cell division transport system permease protein
MNANRMRYIIEESMIMMKRRKGSTLISIVIMGLSLLILVIFLLVTLNISIMIGRASEELRVYVYLEEGIGQEDSREIQFNLLELSGVDEVVFVARQEALELFREALGDDSDLLDVLDDNPLPDAYRLKMKLDAMRGEVLERFSREIEEWQGVEEVRYGRRWFERGERLVKGFYLADLALGLIIFLSVIFVISNTVRLTILSRRRTIDIMKLVGAPNSYIQIPIIIEGALQGIVAALLALGLAWVLFSVANRYFPGLTFFGIQAVSIFTGFCAILGALGSYTAMRRFLKIQRTDA